MIRKQRWLLKATLLLLFGLLGLAISRGASIVYAADCSSLSIPGWYPPTYSYNDSFVSLYGKTETCWQGENFSQKGYSSGSQYPSSPLSRIRSKVEGWEEINGSQCTITYSNDSGWKYGWYSVWATIPYRHYECTGSSSHYYVAKTTHYFGQSSTATTGNK